jgi:hypothetical protein
MKKSHLTGYGKKLWKAHKQKGGSWSDFTSWVKRQGNNFYEKVAKPVYEKVIKPAGEYIAKKPITVAAKLARAIPVYGSAIGTAGDALASMTGMGEMPQMGGARGGAVMFG